MSRGKGRAVAEVELDFAAAEGGAAGRLAPSGSAVVVLPVAGCGECAFCRDGRDNLCPAPVDLPAASGDQGWSRRMTVDQRLVLPAPDGVPPRLAALVPLVAELLRAVERCNVGEGEALSVPGDGAEADLARLIAKTSGVAMATAGDDRASHPTVVLHLSPGEDALGGAIDTLGRVGRVVTTRAANADPMKMPDYYRQMIIKETAIIGSGRPSRADLAKAAALLRSRAADPLLLPLAGRFRVVELAQ